MPNHMSDIDDIINGNDDGYNGQPEKKKKNVSLYKRTDYEPALPDKEKFNLYGRSFSVYGYEETPDDIKEIIKGHIAKLMNIGFTYHTNLADGYNKLSVEMKPQYMDRTSKFGPWKNYNDDKETIFNTQESYQAVTALLKWYQDPKTFEGDRGKTSLFIRSIKASDIMNMLGPKLDTPLRLIITYTENGEESGKTFDYKDMNPKNKFFMSTAKKYDIPVFNLKNPGTNERLNQFIENFAK